jgi:hypothetical protein
VGEHPHVDDEGLADLLEQQSGVVARRQLLGLGCRPHDIERLTRRRVLTRVHHGVYVDHTGPLMWRQRAWAGVLALWPAALCDGSALCDGPEPTGAPEPTAVDTLIHVAVERHRRLVPPEGVRVHRMSRLDERVLWNRCPPRLRYEDAALDVAARAGSDFAALGVLADACRTRRTTPQRLVDTLDRRPRVHRRAWLTAVLADLTDGTTSVLEHGYRTSVQRAHGLPRAAHQVRAAVSAGVVYRDLEYDCGLVVELDGRLVHNTVTQRDADFERDLDTAVEGRATVRLSWGQVIGRPCSTAGKIGRLLRLRGWTGHPRPCSPHCAITH